jgi:Icc-related predicted phosphoesterase
VSHIENKEEGSVKILVISDAISGSLYEYFDSERFAEVEMVISCGDLPADYLEFVISMLNVPCFYVPGNHDTSFIKKKPLGWIPLDGRMIQHQGVAMLGLGGSMRYKPGPFQYTEFEMKKRLLKLKPSLWMQKNKIDILVAHAPAYQLGDMEERPHCGFQVFREILDTYSPKFFLHGHVHLNYQQTPRIQEYGTTQIINGYQYYIFDYPEERSL